MQANQIFNKHVLLDHTYDYVGTLYKFIISANSGEILFALIENKTSGRVFILPFNKIVNIAEEYLIIESRQVLADFESFKGIAEGKFLIIDESNINHPEIGKLIESQIAAKAGIQGSLSYLTFMQYEKPETNVPPGIPPYGKYPAQTLDPAVHENENPYGYAGLHQTKSEYTRNEEQRVRNDETRMEFTPKFDNYSQLQTQLQTNINKETEAVQKLIAQREMASRELEQIRNEIAYAERSREENLLRITSEKAEVRDLMLQKESLYREINAAKAELDRVIKETLEQKNTLLQQANEIKANEERSNFLMGDPQAELMREDSIMAQLFMLQEERLKQASMYKAEKQQDFRAEMGGPGSLEARGAAPVASGLKELWEPSPITAGLRETGAPEPVFAGLRETRAQEPAAAGLREFREPEPISEGLRDLRMPEPVAAGLRELRTPEPVTAGFRETGAPEPATAGLRESRSQEPVAVGLRETREPAFAESGLKEAWEPTPSAAGLNNTLDLKPAAAFKQEPQERPGKDRPGSIQNLGLFTNSDTNGIKMDEEFAYSKPVEFIPSESSNFGSTDYSKPDRKKEPAGEELDLVQNYIEKQRGGLIGKTLRKNVFDGNGNVLLNAGTVITDKVFDDVSEKSKDAVVELAMFAD